MSKRRAEVHARSNGDCEAGLPGCTRAAQEIHHIRLRSRGGSNDLRNLMDVCHSCHVRITLNKPGTNRFRTYRWQKEGLRESDAPEWKG